MYIHNYDYLQLTENEKFPLDGKPKSGVYTFWTPYYNGSVAELIRINIAENEDETTADVVEFKYYKNQTGVKYNKSKLEDVGMRYVDVTRKKTVQIPVNMFNDIINIYEQSYLKFEDFFKGIQERIKRHKIDKYCPEIIEYVQYKPGVYHFIHQFDETYVFVKIDYKSESDCRVYYQTWHNGKQGIIERNQKSLFEYTTNSLFEDQFYSYDGMTPVTEYEYLSYLNQIDEMTQNLDQLLLSITTLYRDKLMI